jgi:divinyl chlorophyllide a 8-vinyl-reductase
MMVGKKVMLLGATGTIGRAVAQALVRRGHAVTAPVRSLAGGAGAGLLALSNSATSPIEVREAQVTDAASLERDGFRGERFDALVSCLASRTGAPQDAWAIDHRAHLQALAVARRHGVGQMVLLSAICVQKPRLEFQRAKLAFETALIDSGMPYSIVRPTAFFKSLSGQFERVRRGKSYLLFGNGALTRCKPISDRDLGDYIADCLEDPARINKVLPIGGPGPAISPIEQGRKLFEILGREPKFSRVPVGMLDTVIAALSLAGRLSRAAADKAELARIGRYYATESMLLLDPATGQYNEDLTPSTGAETLFDYFAELALGGAPPDRGDHAVF